MHKHHPKNAASTKSARPGPTTASQAAGTTDGQEHPHPMVTEEDIRCCAYWKWERAGKPHGDGLQFWLDAERELAHGI